MPLNFGNGPGLAAEAAGTAAWSGRGDFFMLGSTKIRKSSSCFYRRSGFLSCETVGCAYFSKENNTFLDVWESVQSKPSYSFWEAHMKELQEFNQHWDQKAGCRFRDIDMDD